MKICGRRGAPVHSLQFGSIPQAQLRRKDGNLPSQLFLRPAAAAPQAAAFTANSTALSEPAFSLPI